MQGKGRMGTVGALSPYRLRLRRKPSFSTSLSVFYVRIRARKTHSNWFYNLWSPQATNLYGDIALIDGNALIARTRQTKDALMMEQMARHPAYPT